MQSVNPNSTLVSASNKGSSSDERSPSPEQTRLPSPSSKVPRSHIPITRRSISTPMQELSTLSSTSPAPEKPTVPFRNYVVHTTSNTPRSQSPVRASIISSPTSRSVKPSTVAQALLPKWLSQALTWTAESLNSSAPADVGQNASTVVPVMEYPLMDPELMDDTHLVSGTDRDLMLKHNEELNGLITHAKQVASQLQTLVERGTSFDLSVDGRPPTYDELLTRLNGVLSYQHDINQVTAKLTATNYVVNMVSFVRQKQLKALVQQGRAQLTEMKGHVAELELEVDTLNTDVAVQQKLADRLRTSLDVTRGLLDQTVMEYRQEMSRQRDILEQQNQTLKKLYESKLNQDVVLDVTVFAASWYIVRLDVLKPVFQGVSSTLGWLVIYLYQQWLTYRQRPFTNKVLRRRQTSSFLRILLQATMLVILVEQCRNQGKRYGLYSQVGSATDYLKFMMNRIFGRLKGKKKMGSTADALAQ